MKITKELRTILKDCWKASRDYIEDKTDKNFNDFIDKLNSK